MKVWYPDGLAVPVHVVDRYIELELKGYKLLKEGLSKSTG
jgi:hypothetical protein